MTDIYKIRLHRKTATEPNPHSLALVFWENSNFGPWRRTFRHRKIDAAWIAERDMTENEKQLVKRSWRLHYMLYKNWEGLISDEVQITNDTKWIENLKTLSLL